MRLDWTVTNDLYKKTGRQVNALKRLCHHISQDVRMAVFRAFILKNFQYCPVIWHHCSVSNTRKLEQIQVPVLRYITNDYKSEYRSLLCQTSLPSLIERRRQQTTTSIQTFKILNNILPQCLLDLIIPRKCTRILTNSVKTLEIPFYNKVGTRNKFIFILGTKDLKESTRGNSYTI